MSRSLLYLSFAPPAGGGTGTHRTIKLTRQLSRLGWDVVILCGRSATLPCPASCGDVPVIGAFSPFPFGGAGSAQSAAPDGQGPARGPRASRVLRDLVKRLVFVPDPQLYWIPFAVIAAWRRFGKRRPDALFASGPPFSTFILGSILRILWRVPLVLDYRDVWQDHPWWPVPRFRAPLERFLERRIHASAGLVIANHAAMRKALERSDPGLAERCIVLPNGFDAEELGAPVRSRWTPGRRFEIVYAGTLYGPTRFDRDEAEPLSIQRPKAFLTALGRLLAKGAFGAGGARVRFVGAREGTHEAETLLACAAECGVAGRVEVIPRLEKPDVVRILREAHLLLNILYYTEAQVAQKIYEYLHLEIPILSLLRRSGVNEVPVLGARAGPVVDPADVSGIEMALSAIVERYARGGSPVSFDRAYIDLFDLRNQGRSLSDHLEDLIRARATPGEAHAPGR